MKTLSVAVVLLTAGVYAQAGLAPVQNEQLTELMDTNQLAMASEEAVSRTAVITPQATFVNAPAAKRKSAPANAGRRPLPDHRGEIKITRTGARADFGPHQVDFAANLNTAEAVNLTLPAGGRMRSHILGLAYYDPASDTNVLIAELKDCPGELASASTVIYRDAFEGVTADVLYEYTSTSLEQNVIIRRRLPAPEEFGLSSDSARLAVLTEFVDSVQPRKVARRINIRKQRQALGLRGEDSLDDETLYFGSMRMVEGKAFTLGDRNESIPVGKSWLELEPGRWFPAILILGWHLGE